MNLYIQFLDFDVPAATGTFRPVIFVDYIINIYIALLNQLSYSTALSIVT